MLEKIENINQDLLSITPYCQVLIDDENNIILEIEQGLTKKTRQLVIQYVSNHIETENLMIKTVFEVPDRRIRFESSDIRHPNYYYYLSNLSFLDIVHNLKKHKLLQNSEFRHLYHVKRRDYLQKKNIPLKNYLKDYLIFIIKCKSINNDIIFESFKFIDDCSKLYNSVNDMTLLISWDIKMKSNKNRIFYNLKHYPHIFINRCKFFISPDDLIKCMKLKRLLNNKLFQTKIENWRKSLYLPYSGALINTDWTNITKMKIY